MPVILITADRRKYKEQRAMAKHRGIEFKLTFQQWRHWWERELGADWRNHRGVGRDKFCMARFNDQGAYELGNIECKLHVENHRQANIGNHYSLGYRHTKSAKLRIGKASKGNRYGQTKLTDTQALQIKRVEGTHRDIANRFHVSQSHVTMIKNGQRYGWLR